MTASAMLLTIGVLAFGACFALSFLVIRTITRRDNRTPVRLPNDGRTETRARRLQEESERYRNLLVEQLIYAPRERGRRR